MIPDNTNYTEFSSFLLTQNDKLSLAMNASSHYDIITVFKNTYTILAKVLITASNHQHFHYSFCVKVRYVTC